MKYYWLFLFVMGGLQPLQAQKKICITLDDLPGVSYHPLASADYDSLTRQLLASLQTYHVPAVGFVIGNQLLTNGQPDLQKLALLERWLRAGMELGNHTFAHRGFNTFSAQTYQRDVWMADSLLRPWLTRQKQPLRYFRHPYLQRGNTEPKRDSLVAYLTQLQYREAPVTLDNADYIFSKAYEKAGLADSIGQQYVRYLLAVVDYYESQTQALLNRPMAHILGIHANPINARYLGVLLAALQERGYQFVSLKEALQDSAYQMADRYVGTAGISWIHRWALSLGKKGAFFRGEPEVPAAVARFAEDK